MPVNWMGPWPVPDTPPPPRIGRPNRGNRAKVKAARKAAHRR